MVGRKLSLAVKHGNSLFILWLVLPLLYNSLVYTYDGSLQMRTTPENIRKLFTLRHGERAFESVAKRYAEVAGDSASVDLSTIPEWRDFAISIRTVPNGDVLRRAFLWCTRHRQPLMNLDRPAVPPALEAIEDPAILRQLFDLFPFFIANSQYGFRCKNCFEAAERFTESLPASPDPSDVQYLIARAEDSVGGIESNSRKSRGLG